MRRMIACATALALLACGAAASVLHLFDACVPLLDPQQGVVVRRVTFLSRYSQPESTVNAAVWPYRPNVGPEEETSGEANPAALLGVKVSVVGLVPGEGEQPALTVDLRQLRPLPESMRERHPEVSRAEIVRGVIIALNENLRLAGVEDCRLVVVGAREHEDLAEMRFPPVLNREPTETPDQGEG